MSEEPRRPRHAAPDDQQQVAPPSWQPPPPVRWDTPEPSISGRLDDGEPSGGEETVFHAPVRRPPTPPRGQPFPARGPIPGAEDPTRPPGSMNPVTPPVEPTQAVRPDPGAPQPTSVLAAPAPETQSIMPPVPRPETGPGTPLPDPGTESVLPERTSEGRHTGTGTGTGAGSGSGSVSGSFPGTSRRTSSRTSRSRRGRLGAGLVEVPPVPARDPASAVLTNPVVSEEKRFCGTCNAKVGRGKDGQPGSPEGKCENCGAPFSFVPKLQPNELVGGQYEVLGAIAYGGLGWIYLAQDHNVSDRWVVLKGLIDTGDATAMAAAANEQRFLAEVEHPNIVKIHNFVQHPDAHSGTTTGYIVMEYVGGQSLRQLALAHHRESRRPEPLPIGQVIAYGLEILPALGYLHSQGLLYCDLKPDNVIQTNEQLKLIDLGAVRRTDDYESPLFFTTGYSAPELPTQGASVASDLFTVGRTLAVLSFEFTGYTSKYKTTTDRLEQHRKVPYGRVPYGRQAHRQGAQRPRRKPDHAGSRARGTVGGPGGSAPRVGTPK
ncbi:protein kinase [Amycolatopsis mediterranei S699]|uniref:non-specific serine/threonine protein kinase n=1 Tax=Amycolatopsis mediterranei (strain S699) TaxID=713604 RepID=A0A9R0NQN6_AMYMS|nr:protein kinase [Amycolatopsis mediterranei S699]